MKRLDKIKAGFFIFGLVIVLTMGVLWGILFYLMLIALWGAGIQYEGKEE